MNGDNTSASAAAAAASAAVSPGLPAQPPAGAVGNARRDPVATFSSEERVDDGLATSYVVKRLAKYTKYELVVAPYYRSVVGVDSLPSDARTFEDGEPRLSTFWFLYARVFRCLM